MIVKILGLILVLLLATIGPAVTMLVLAYCFRVGEDVNAIYTSISLGTILNIASIASTVVTLLYGMSVVSCINK